MMTKSAHSPQDLGLSKEEVESDYKIATISRFASLLGRKEVLSGKAKFGIFGDGKEIAQLAMARAFQKGDWRSGYYRDQTFALAVGAITVRQFFAQLYADTDLEREPCSGGRQMNSHFASRFLDSEGQWLNQVLQCNSSADLSPTAAQMSRLVGLAYASKLYREQKGLAKSTSFSLGGNEVAFGTIGNASTSEGIFWEAMNAAGVLQIPMAVSVWDDGYGISVPNRYQTTKESISDLMSGFQQEDGRPGFDIYVQPGWNYSGLCKAYQEGINKTRLDHAPCLFHVTEMTQPQGHSTSGSHERYKSKDRLKFEEDRDCLRAMRQWMIEQDVATEGELDALEKHCEDEVQSEKSTAWEEYQRDIGHSRDELVAILSEAAENATDPTPFESGIQSLSRQPTLYRKTVHSAAKRVQLASLNEATEVTNDLREFISDLSGKNRQIYRSHLVNELRERSPLWVKPVPASIAKDAERVDGRVIIQKLFDHHIANDPKIFIIGEDVGKLGGVNLEFEGLSEKHGESRVTDTGIREATILGQGIGAAMRGLRPVVDIQYLDYLLYAFQVMSDDLATLHYRTAGGQAAPVIVRTKGHRLEGIWHTGSPMGTVIHGLRGVHVCVPRNMTQAAGMYNTLLKGDDPALVIEVLNGYRVKENLPANLTEFTVPLGMPEVIRSGSDLTVATYGACVRVAEEAAQLLSQLGIDCEIIDVQTLLPFDRSQALRKSIEKTHAVLFLDEDVPGGATAYMMQQVLETQAAYDFLDCPPRTLTAQPHRSAYASDGDYYSKPNAEDIVELAYDLMSERAPQKFNRREALGLSPSAQ